MTTGHPLSIGDFMAQARGIIESDSDLQDVQSSIAERLAVLSQRDDLTRYGLQLGPTDASTGSYLLWREPPHFTLLMIRLAEHFASPVHDHGDHWIVACGYRGVDRWDMYERTDGHTGPGSCQLELVRQATLEPGDTIVLPPPPAAIHSHNNLHDGETLELIFSAVPPLPAARRMIFDVPESTCRSSWYEISEQLSGEHFPPRGGTTT